MTCEHSNCSFNIFSSCINHCNQNLCLEHLIEHGDIFLNDFTNLLNLLDTSTATLMKETNYAATQINQCRQKEIERINAKYNKEQENIRKRITFAESANTLLKDKQGKIFKSKEENICYLGQYDIEQIKFYTNEIENLLCEQEFKQEPLTINTKATNNSNSSIKRSWTTYTCPLTRPNVFGIKSEHNIRLDCDGTSFLKYHLSSHFENYHRMLPECAARLKNAIINGELSHETKLFDEHEIIYNQECLTDCPLTDANNVFGAQLTLSELIHIPCPKKQMLLSSMLSHFQSYHKMKYQFARKIFHAMKNKSLMSDTMLFENNQRLGTKFRRK